MAFVLVELRILFIIILAEIYNSISVLNFNRSHAIEYFLDSQCNDISKILKKYLKYKIISHCYDEIILITRIQKGGGLRDIYNKISLDKNVLTLSTSIFDFRSLERKDYLKKNEIKKITNIGIISRIKIILSYISSLEFKKLHIINDSCDPLIYISYLICSRDSKDFIFYHHADHSFCFGSFEKNWIHMDLFQNQYLICKERINSTFKSMIDFL